MRILLLVDHFTVPRRSKMNTILITFLVACWLSCISCRGGVKLWSSKVPRKKSVWRTSWNIDTSTYRGRDSVSAVSNPDGSRPLVTAITLSEGSYYLTGTQSGAEFYSAPLPSRTCFTLRYQVRFEKDFNFAYGGKLPGLYGGGVNCTAGIDPKKDCFTTRFIWRTGGLGGLSLYTPQVSQMKGFCNRWNVECNDDWGHKLNLKNLTFQAEKWYTVQQAVKLNTPGLADGLLRINFVKIGLLFHAQNVVFRNSAEVMVDGIMLSNFFGGSSPCSASPKNQKVYFRSFQLRDNFCN